MAKIRNADIKKHKATMLLYLVQGRDNIKNRTVKCTRSTIGGDCNAKFKRRTPHFTTGTGQYLRYICYPCGKSLAKFALIDVATWDKGLYIKLDKSEL